MPQTKKCQECLRRKPLSAFYVNKRMTDGYLNQCKDCVKARVARHRLDNVDRIRVYERKRAMLPHRIAARAAYVATFEGQEAMAKGAKAWIDRNPEKRKCHITFGNALRDGKITRQPCERCGDAKSQAHHSDYSKPLKVRWLCRACHVALHKRKRGGRGYEPRTDLQPGALTWLPSTS